MAQRRTQMMPDELADEDNDDDDDDDDTKQSFNNVPTKRCQWFLKRPTFQEIKVEDISSFKLNQKVGNEGRNLVRREREL